MQMCGKLPGASPPPHRLLGYATAQCCAARREALVSRCVSRVCKPSIATLNVKGIIWQRIKKYVNNEPPNYMMRRCSRTLQPRRTAPFASYQCRRNFYAVPHFHPRQYHPECLFTNLRFKMRSWHKLKGNNNILVAGRTFVKGVSIPSVSLEMKSVRFEIPKVAKQMKRMVNK